MKILAVGDIVGKNGLQKLKDCLPNIIKENNIDFVIVNGENAADGMGITEKMYREILSLNVNVVTMGNHTWGKKEIFNFIDDKNIIRPANYSKNNPGRGYDIYECKGKKIGVINLIGRTPNSLNATVIVFKDLAETGIINGKTYTFSASQQLTNGVEIRCECYNESNWQRHLLGSVLNRTHQTITATANTTGTTRIRFMIYVGAGNSVNIENLLIKLEEA